MEKFDLSSHSHRRYNPLTSSWILVSPHRTKRPWLGQTEDDNPEILPEYDPKCYLCPGNVRANNEVNPAYESTFTFRNDFPAVKADQPEYLSEENENSLLKIEGVRGQCHVVCFSPKHNLTVAEMSEPSILSVVRTWASTYSQLSNVPYINYVEIFENKGATMGCSNPHPHCQIWATESIPQEPARELESMRSYRNKKGSCMLCDYSTLETSGVEGCPRVVCENEGFVCVVPFWAVWPYETMVLAKRHVARLSDLTQSEMGQLANIIRRVTCRYDNIFRCSFPYSMGIHQAPTNGQEQDEDSHLHLHFYPPLLRSSTVKKFLVGYEMLGEPQRDLTPEQAAEKLRQCSEEHYKFQKSSPSTTS